MELIHTETHAYREVDGKLREVGLKMFVSAPSLDDIREILRADSASYDGEVKKTKEVS